MNTPNRSSGGLLRQARHQLLEHGETPPAQWVRTVVSRSWLRCIDSGLSPVGRLAEVPHLSATQLSRALERQREFIAHARPVMEYLHGQSHNTSSMVILADSRGILLQALGDADFVDRAERVALMPGASWHEEHRGTNAIGTALMEAAPVVVHGPEHFLERNAFLTCAAATITAPNGQPLGVLDISGDQRGHHPHTFGLVRTAAQMIENRLFDARHGNSVRLRFHPLAEGIGTIAEGVIALSEDGKLIGANRAGLALLGLGAHHLGATPLSHVLHVRLNDLLTWARQRPGEAMLVEHGRGGRYFVRVEANRCALSVAIAARPPLAAPAAADNDALASLDSGDERMAAAIERARKVLGKQIPILLQGEAGAGKEVFARALHASGPHGHGPFVAINCAAIDLNSHAPTFEAEAGTLFLDDIGDLPPDQQPRLLRLLEERHGTDFTLVCTSRRPLRAEVDGGRFNADLYYHINGLVLNLPALRERQDLAALTAGVLEQVVPGRGLTLTPDLAAAFANYTWPGNLRQLANALHLACALAEPGITRIDWHHLADDLAEELRHPVPRSASEEPAESLRSLSDHAIERAIALAHGNMSEAARRLGISRNTLYRRLRRPATGG